MEGYTWWLVFSTFAALVAFYIAIGCYDKCDVSRFKYAKRICEIEGYEFFFWYYVQSFFIRGKHIQNIETYSPIVDAQIYRVVMLALDGTYDSYRNSYNEIRVPMSKLDQETMKFKVEFKIDTHKLDGSDSVLLPRTHKAMNQLVKKVEKHQGENSSHKDIDGY